MMLAGESMNEMVKVITGYRKDHPDVLLIVTADHETGGMTIEGAEAQRAVHHNTHVYGVVMELFGN